MYETEQEITARRKWLFEWIEEEKIKREELKQDTRQLNRKLDQVKTQSIQLAQMRKKYIDELIDLGDKLREVQKQKPKKSEE